VGSWKIGGGCGGGGGGDRAREVNELKCPSRQRAEGDIDWASVPCAEQEIPSFAHNFYGRP
jgi:hypothetical protein